MANKIITFVIDTLEQELEPVIAATIDKLHSLGHTIKEIRVMGDSGESKVAVNTVAGVTVPEPIGQVTTPENAPEANVPEATSEPPAVEPPADSPPVDTPPEPVDPTPPAPADTQPSDTPPSDTPPSDTPPA